MSKHPNCAVDERSIPTAHGSLRLRVFRPSAATTEERGGLIFFHAGGFVTGDPANHDVLCGQLSAGSGCVIVSSAYRLAPEHRFPAALDDAYYVSCFVHEHADEFGIDHRRLGIAGIEVGASLATGVARLAKERRNPALGLQLLIDPWLDFRALDAFGIGAYASASEREDPRCSPLLAQNLIGLPPVCIARPEGGPASGQAEAYAARLREAQIPVQLWSRAGTTRELIDAPDGSDAARDTMRKCAQALERALGAVGRDART